MIAGSLSTEKNLAIDALARQINELLPQTQCTRCGFAGCAPYAQAISAKVAPINQCPPGGARTISDLARLLNAQALPLNPEHGEEGPLRLARIVEADCIGCTKCIQACPVDAIHGASKRMHTVITSECTGCELCVPSCPVDCIVLETSTQQTRMTPDTSKLARARFEARADRLERRANEQAAATERKTA